MLWSNIVKTGSYCSPAMCWYATLRSSSLLTCQPERFRKPSKPCTQPYLNSCTYTGNILWFVHVSVLAKIANIMAPGSLEHTNTLSYVQQSRTATNTATIGQLTVAEVHECHGISGPADCSLILLEPNTTFVLLATSPSKHRHLIRIRHVTLD